MSMMDYFKKAKDKAEKKKQERNGLGLHKSRGGQSNDARATAKELEDESSGRVYADAGEDE